MSARPARADLDLLAELAAAQDAFAALLATADPDAPVPACGTWTVTDLALHLGGVHRWAAGMARGVDDGGDDPTSPRDPDEVLAFYRTHAALLRATLRDLDPAAPALTLNGPGPAAFWHRRQVHETVVHLHDLADAVGVAHPIDDPVLWADTVDEVVTVLTPRQVRLGRIAPLHPPVALTATDAERTWLLGGGDAGAVSVTVHGPASRLALLLWGRTVADDPALTIEGDRATLDATLSVALTP